MSFVTPTRKLFFEFWIKKMSEVIGRAKSYSKLEITNYAYFDTT